MHLLATTAGTISNGEEAIDLAQSPGDIVVLSVADSELTCFAKAAEQLGDGFPSVRLANLLQLKHPYSVDLYVEKVIAKARFVCVVLLGGRSYWPYGVDEIAAVARARGIAFAALSDGIERDPSLEAVSTLPEETLDRLRDYLRQGGVANAANFLRTAANLIGEASAPAAEPLPVPDAGLYLRGVDAPTLANVRAGWTPGRPLSLFTFYRALVTAGTTDAVDAVTAALQARGLDVLAVHVRALREPFAVAVLADLIAEAPPDVVLNATAFAASAPARNRRASVLEQADAPILQLAFAGVEEAAWRDSPRGLGPRDLAMNVALPEVDGRIFTRAVAFKAAERFDACTETSIVVPRVAPDRVAFVADLAAAWARLRRAPAAERRVALVLANYPNRDGRLGNGVGLDTPASTAAILLALREAGYDTGDAPEDGAALMAKVSAGVTNAKGAADRPGEIGYPVADYLAAFADLPAVVRTAVSERWGEPVADPFVRGDAFRLPAHRFGKVLVAVQPARGYNIDPKATYHDPALVPPHGYLAFHLWLRKSFDAHAVVHVGKHGNLEWLPGKALALSDACFPEVCAGPVPQIYPFIVNDPGEGTQAKRRIGAVIVDHLTPPLTRAESYGPLKALEALVDEYYLAAGMDPRRLERLRADILDLATSHGLDQDAGASGRGDEALAAIDNYLCELKEMQIRDGLHVFTRSPTGRLRTDLLVALARARRIGREAGDASLIRALADDLALGFDPLDVRLGDPWTGPRTATLASLDDAPWRTVGDTVERLEALAVAVVEGHTPPGPASAAVAARIASEIAPDVDACGAAELEALLAALDGRFVVPGPSGAPTRGRPDVLPTGRNFYSMDTRAVPTPTAWDLGWRSAQLLVEDHFQREGAYPGSIALSAWGTANMRTGGDDIAQALALIGCRPTWDLASGRVTGFEVLPPARLGRPRVDVTLRVSGFFRDAFPEQIDLVDSASRAVMALDEPEEDNPAAARWRAESARLEAQGDTAARAARRAGARVYGSAPGAYGAGLQAMIDERLWHRRSDLAEVYLDWGGYAYGAGVEGERERELFTERLRTVDAVVQNQDNREHDLLDSDDYYQFEGGIAAAVEHLKGSAPVSYHNDHSRPERPIIRTLEDEIGRIVRARVVNPKWIAGVMRHGYKGAFEIAATIDYLFAFAATTHAVKDHHFDAVHAAFIENEAVRAFMADANPCALRETAARLGEAIERGLWRPKSNSAGLILAQLQESPP